MTSVYPMAFSWGIINFKLMVDFFDNHQRQLCSDPGFSKELGVKGKRVWIVVLVIHTIRLGTFQIV